MSQVTNDQLLRAIEASGQQRTEELAVLKEQVAQLKVIAEQNVRALRGFNGETGLVAEVESLGETMAAHAANEKTCPIGRVVPVLFGSPEAGIPGLVQTVNEMVKWRKMLQKWYGVGVGAIIVGVINIILALLLEYFKRAPGP